MAEQGTAMQPKKESAAPVPLSLVNPEDLFKRIEELHDSIAHRAFEFFESNGCIFGRDLDDWFRAEGELFHPVHVDLTESDEGFAVRAELPGFKSEELEISLDGSRLAITGKRETKEKHKDEKTVYKERCSDQILRVIDLPAAVDAGKVKATLANGVLELKVPKTASSKKIPIESKAA